jgi:hypothetical protein
LEDFIQSLQKINDDLKSQRFSNLKISANNDHEDDFDRGFSIIGKGRGK